MGTAATRAKNKYAKKNYDRIILLVPIGQKQNMHKKKDIKVQANL